MSAESRSAGRFVAAVAVPVIIAVLAALAISTTDSRLRERISSNEREYLLRGLNEIVRPDTYDNAMFDDTLTVRDPDLSGGEPVTVYRASDDGVPVAAVFEITTKGYSGPITLLVGVASDGRLTGVRASDHRETPGLGDAIDADKSDWILQFDGLSLLNPPLDDWAVRRDGGVFDQFTGATITPRAVIGGVRDTLLYFAAHKGDIFPQLRDPEA